MSNLRTYMLSKQPAPQMRLLKPLLHRAFLLIVWQIALLPAGNAQTTCTDSLLAVKRNYATTIRVAQELAAESNKKDTTIMALRLDINQMRIREATAYQKMGEAINEAEKQRRLKNKFIAGFTASLLANLVIIYSK